jgi:Tfp pilus assembly protein PilO
LALPKISLEKLPPFVRTLLLIAPITIAFLLINLFVLGPKARRLEAAKTEVNKLRTEINKNRQQLADFQPLSEQEKTEMAEAEEVFQLMVGSLRSVREVYDKITTKAVSCGITDLSIDPSYKPHQAQEILRIETELGVEQYRSYMKLNCHCELKSLGCFLRDLTGGEDYIIIESLIIKRELPKPGVELVLKLFTKS